MFGGFGIGFRDGGFADLVASDPNFAVGDGEAHDVVDKGLCFAGTLGDTEDVCEKFSDEN